MRFLTFGAVVDLFGSIAFLNAGQFWWKREDSLTPVVTCSFLKIKIAIFFLCIRVEVMHSRCMFLPIVEPKCDLVFLDL